MGIKDQVSDAKYLAQDGRNLGALSMLLLAVAASSRRLFPEGVARSLTHPKNFMGSGEAFKLFLGGRLNRIMFGGRVDKPGGGALVTKTPKGEFGLADVLYTYFRNDLIHEGGLRPGAELVETATQNGVTFSMSDPVSFDLGLLPLLVEVVEGADCNAQLYEREVYDLRPRAGINEAEFKASVLTEFGISDGRFEMLVSFVWELGRIDLREVTDEELQARLKALFQERRVVHLGALYQQGLTDLEGLLLPKGKAVLRRILDGYERVRVA